MHSDLDKLANGESGGRAQTIAQRLRELPADGRPPYDWEEFRRRSIRRRGWQAVTWRHAAIAAGLALVVVSAAFWVRLVGEGGLEGRGSATAHSSVHIDDATTVQERQRVLAQAEASGRWLANLPIEPAIVRFSTRAAVTDLEDRIAWVDELLTVERLEGAQPARVMVLRGERARLVNSLAQVRYAEVLAAELP